MRIKVPGEEAEMIQDVWKWQQRKICYDIINKFRYVLELVDDGISAIYSRTRVCLTLSLPLTCGVKIGWFWNLAVLLYQTSNIGTLLLLTKPNGSSHWNVWIDLYLLSYDTRWTKHFKRPALLCLVSAVVEPKSDGTKSTIWWAERNRAELIVLAGKYNAMINPSGLREKFNVFRMKWMIGVGKIAG